MNCFICSGDPLEEKELIGQRGTHLKLFTDHQNSFNYSMMDTLFSYQLPCCLISSIPIFIPCIQTNIRYKVLNQIYPESEWENYICCQGYIPNICCCISPGNCGEHLCPITCMCMESIFFPGIAVSVSRSLLMEFYHLQPDPCDNRLIRINNFIQMLNCICYCASNIDKKFKNCSILLTCISDIIFLSTIGCMTAQIMQELKYRAQGFTVEGSFAYNHLQESPEVVEKEPSQDTLLPRLPSPIVDTKHYNPITDQYNFNTSFNKNDEFIPSPQNDESIIL